MSGSTPKKPVSSRAKKRNNDRPSVADFCRLCKCSFKTVYGNFPSKSTSSELSKDPQPKASYISTENIFNTSCRNGEERDSLKSIFDKLEFTVLQSNSLSPRMCRKCATKVRNAEPVIELIRKELNRSHHLFERDQQEESLDQDKENVEKEGRFKRMSKSPHGSQKHKVFRIASAKRNDLEPSKEKRPALARRSLAMENKVEDVREHMLRDKMVEELTTLESEVPAKRKASVKVIVSDSRMTVRTPKSSIASSLIKHILLHKWQQVVNTLFKVEEALPHLQDALTKAVNREFKWFCHSSSTLTMKSPEEIMKFTNKALLNEASRKCPIYYSCIFGTAGLIGKKKEMDWKTVNATAAATAVLARKRNSRMSAFAYRMSSILLHSGAKSADFTRLNRLGICMSHQETVRKQKEMGESFDARVLQWKEAAEKEKATNNVQANPCGSTSGVSMEVEEIAQPTTFKRYRYLRTGIIKVLASAFSLYF